MIAAGGGGGAESCRRRGGGGEEEAVPRQKHPGTGRGLEGHRGFLRGAGPPLWSATFLCTWGAGGRFGVTRPSHPPQCCPRGASGQAPPEPAGPPGTFFFPRRQVPFAQGFIFLRGERESRGRGRSHEAPRGQGRGRLSLARTQPGPD